MAIFNSYAIAMLVKSWSWFPAPLSCLSPLTFVLQDTHGDVTTLILHENLMKPAARSGCSKSYPKFICEIVSMWHCASDWEKWEKVRKTQTWHSSREESAQEYNLCVAPDMNEYLYLDSWDPQKRRIIFNCQRPQPLAIAKCFAFTGKSLARQVQHLRELHVETGCHVWCRMSPHVSKVHPWSLL